MHQNIPSDVSHETIHLTATVHSYGPTWTNMKVKYLFLCLFHITTSVQSQFNNNFRIVNTESGNLGLRMNQVKHNLTEAMK